MNMPGFTAEASLGAKNRRYRLTGTTGALAGGEAVVPQLGTTMQDWWDDWVGGEGVGGGGGGGGGYQTHQQCVNAAYDRYTSCSRTCNARSPNSCTDRCYDLYAAAVANCPPFPLR